MPFSLPRRAARRAGGLVTLLLAAGGAVALGAAAPAAAVVPPTVVYAAPAGHGVACTSFAPCSLASAQGRVRTLTRHQSRDIVVQLAGGTYRLDRPLVLDAAEGDGGRNRHTVSYAAAPGATPVLDGADRITGWHAGAGGVWSAKVPAAADSRQLYVDGVRATPAQGSAPTSFTRTATGYTMSNTTMDSWGNPTDIEFVYNVAWTQMRCGVAAIDGTTVTMKQPCFDNSTKKQYGVNADNPSFVENARELLDQPGEFYLDDVTHTLYYLPRAGQQMPTADAELPALQTLVSGTGTEAAPLVGLSLRGITFAYAGWTGPDGDDGFSEVQANMRLTGDDAWQDQGSCDRFSSTDPGTCPYGNWTMTPGNVVFDHTSGLSITGDTFTHLGAAGLQLGRNVTGSQIAGNIFTDISGNGLEIGNGTDADPADVWLLPSDNTISDNWVHNVAVDYTGGVGIFQGYTRDDVIEHNQINNVPYSGISSNWGWGRTPTETQGNKILDTLVFDQMQQRSDGGGIYVLGQQGDTLADGLLIQGNVVRNSDSAGGGHAIYTDGGSENITMTGNAMFGNDTPSMGGCNEQDGTPYGNFDYTGNYVEDTTPDWPCGNPSNATIDNIQVSEDGTGVPAALIANAGLEPAYQHLTAAPGGRTPTNLALGKPVQAQFLDGSTAALQPESQLSYATDGDASTYVQASGQFRWQLVVDLGKSRTLGYLTIGMPQPHFATDFHVDASTDDSSWTIVATVHESGWGDTPVDFATPVTARYLRIVADKPDNGGQRGDQMAISEVGAYPPVNLAAGGSLRLTTAGTVADLGAVQQVSTVNARVLGHSAYSLAASTDGTSWTTVPANSASGSTTLATPVAARYLRFAPVTGRGPVLLTGVTVYGSNNLALNRPAQVLFVDGTQAAMQPNETPADGDDGDASTWAQATGQYRFAYQVDLQRPTSIDTISLVQPDGKFATAFHVDVSTDGSSFTTVARRTDADQGITAIRLDRAVQARYVRVIADRPDNGGQTGGQMAVSELQVFGPR